MTLGDEFVVPRVSCGADAEWRAEHREELNARRRVQRAERAQEINARRRARYAKRRGAQTGGLLQGVQADV